MDFTCLTLQRSNATFSESDSKYFRPVVHLGPVTTAQLCDCFIKVALDTADTNGCGCHPMKHQLQKLAGPADLACGEQFADLYSILLTYKHNYPPAQLLPPNWSTLEISKAGVGLIP